MTINLSAELGEAILSEAKRLGTTPDLVVEQALREKLAKPAAQSPLIPRDEWERRLLSIARPCGVSLSNEALSREELYD
jgi:hypothetical protein